MYYPQNKFNIFFYAQWHPSRKFIIRLNLEYWFVFWCYNAVLLIIFFNYFVFQYELCLTNLLFWTKKTQFLKWRFLQIPAVILILQIVYVCRWCCSLSHLSVSSSFSLVGRTWLRQGQVSSFLGAHLLFIIRFSIVHSHMQKFYSLGTKWYKAVHGFYWPNKKTAKN